LVWNVALSRARRQAASTEPGGGSAMSAMTTAFEPVDGGYRLRGRKHWQGFSATTGFGCSRRRPEGCGYACVAERRSGPHFRAPGPLSATLSPGGSEVIVSTDPGVPRTCLTVTAEADGVAVARLVAVGEVDLSTAEVLGEALTGVLGRSVPVVVVDLAGVGFLDSTGIATLVQARNQFTANGGTLSVVNPQPLVRRVLEITGVLAALTGDERPAPRPGLSDPVEGRDGSAR
jgi:anti-sigma B factor antagonist/stage II sporulation protein AA (anti-sigma F factor antagonist)